MRPARLRFYDGFVDTEKNRLHAKRKPVVSLLFVDEIVENAFLPGLVKIDRQLVAFYSRYIAISELHVKNPVADGEGRWLVCD